MDPASVILILTLVSRGVGVASQIVALANKVKAGERISQAEIDEAESAVASAVARWDDTPSG